MALLRLFDPTTQFQTKSGALNVAGKLRVYVESTDDIANIYGDDGSRLSQPLLLDSNGRARGLFVESGRSYRLEVYDRNDSLLFTIRRLEPNASGTIVNPTVFIKGTPDEIDVEDSVTEESRTYTVALSAKVTGKIDENREAIVKESEARKDADDELRKMIDDSSKAEAGTASPLMDGKASVGNSLKYAREDHVHPSDSSREDKANKTTVVLGTSDSKYPTDKAVADFVNSSIATNTANYISNNGEPFTSVEQLEAYSGPVTNNDYAFVTGTDSEGNTYYDRYKATVSGETVTWALEYRLNNSSFTAAQWSAINSGITSVLVAKIHDHSNKDVLDGITSDKVNSWDGKEDAFNVLPTTKGGTGTNAASKSALTSTLINSLSTESSTPKDADYYVSQHEGGGTTTTSYHRRPVSALWEYIKGKISSVLGLTSSAYSGKASTAGTADKAVSDHSGNNIEETYATRTELNAKQNSLTAGDNITIDGSTISSDQVFVATSWITTYQEIKDAYDAGKMCIINSNNRCYYITEITPEYIRFGTVSPSPNIYSLKVTSNNKWESYNPWLQTRLKFDDEPTAGSTNPVTSKGIKTALDLKANASDLTAHKGDTTVHITAAERAAWNAKQSALTFDTTPTAGSTNPVTSGGIKTALEVLQSNIDDVDAKGIVINEINGENVICFE